MIVRLESTGTPFGISRDLAYLSCERRAWLDEEWKSKQDPNEPAPIFDEGKDSKGKPKPVANVVGTAVHELLRLWRIGQEVPVSGWSFYWYDKEIESTHPATCNEARRIFRAYEMDRSPLEFGRVVATELQLQAPVELFGCEKTGAVDLVAEVGEEEITYLRATFGLELPGPGIYLVDDKTDDRNEGQKTVEEYLMRAQFKLYHMLYDIQHGSTLGEAKGSIANVIFKTAEVKYKPIFIPGPNEDEVKMVAGIVGYAESQRTLGKSGVLPRTRAHDNACRSWGKTCGHYTAGRCKRY